MVTPDNGCQFLVAIETDPIRTRELPDGRPAPLGRNAAEQVLAHLAADLAQHLSGSSSCSLATAGALFDQTQVLRPGFPLLRALAQQLRQAGNGAAGRLLSIGAVDGKLPIAELQPDPSIPVGILQLLPLAIQGDSSEIAALAQQMEHRFLEHGQLSAHSATALQAAFGLAIQHARFMTLNDLQAMFRLQLEHFGFLPLWQLVDAALQQSSEPLHVTTPCGVEFSWRDAVVHAQFQTFDYWAQVGAGHQQDGQRGRLAGLYADWTRELRQYASTLAAHAVPLEFSLPAQTRGKIHGEFLEEHSQLATPPQAAELTEHSFAELGTVCVTTTTDGRMRHFYPLAAAGLNGINSYLRNESLKNRTVSYPGTLLYAEHSRALVPEQLGETHLH